MSVGKRLATIVVEPQKRHTATLFFFHGSGDTADGIKNWLYSVLGTQFCFPHIKIVYPSAPPRPYTIYGGQLSTIWYDQSKFSPDVEEHLESMDHMCQQITTLIDEEIASGTPKDRIIIANLGRISTVWYDRERIQPNVPEHRESVDLMCQQTGELVEREAAASGIHKSRMILGGISMGGGLALHLGYRFHQDVAGVFALSSFLNKDSAVYQSIRDAAKSDSLSSLPPLFACHGQSDPLVLYDWGKKYVDNFKEAGISTEFHSYPNLAHEMCEPELNLLQDWILKRLPDK